MEGISQDSTGGSFAGNMINWDISGKGTHVEIASSMAPTGGGTTITKGNIQIRDGAVVGFRENSAEFLGGGLRCTDQTNVVVHDLESRLVISKNTARSGGGLNFDFGSSLSILNGARLIVTENKALKDGGGLSLGVGGSIQQDELSVAEFYRNTALGDLGGGAISASPGSIMNFQGKSIFTGNKAQTSTGGGISLHPDSEDDGAGECVNIEVTIFRPSLCDYVCSARLRAQLQVSPRVAALDTTIDLSVEYLERRSDRPFIAKSVSACVPCGQYFLNSLPVKIQEPFGTVTGHSLHVFASAFVVVFIR